MEGPYVVAEADLRKRSRNVRRPRMNAFRIARCHEFLRGAGMLVVAVTCLVTLTGADSIGTAPSAVPDFAVPDFSGPWQLNPRNTDFAAPAPGVGPGPLVNVSGNRLVPVANYDSPLLKPWAAEVVKKHGDSLLAGVLAPDAHTSCRPMGVPYVLQVRGTMRLLQTPEWVMIIYMDDNQRRLVRLNVPHTERPKPTAFGESVGHYEGDTLVVDTIGQSIREVSSIDRFGTPHTEALRVVERFRVADDRKTLRVDFTVEDPGAFNMPWHASQTYLVGSDDGDEDICAENIRQIGSGGRIDIPIAEKADF